jgi:thiol-disulfide isomerase/thioredoxin
MLLLSISVTLGAAAWLEARPLSRGISRAATTATPAPRAAPSWKNTSWLNAPAPVTLAALKGRVVLLNFWVFTCFNCTNTVPSLVTFDSKYRDRGLTIVGIHTPEFPPSGGEHDKANVAKALAKYDIRYPIAQDNDRATWNLYHIEYWPSFVLIDKQGRVRYEGYGEFHIGDPWYQEWTKRIETLLAEP